MKAPAPFQPGAGFAGRPRSISTKLNLILLITVTATFLVAGLTLNSWLGTRLEERGIEGLKQTNQQVLDMVEAYANVLERSAEMLGATFQATFLNNLAVDPAHPVQTGDQLLPALRVGDIVHVLYAFQRKSKSGIATPQPDVELIEKRLKALLARYGASGRS